MHAYRSTESVLMLIILSVLITINFYLQHPDLEHIKTQSVKPPQVVVGPESDKNVERRPIGDTLEVSLIF